MYVFLLKFPFKKVKRFLDALLLTWGELASPRELVLEEEEPTICERMNGYFDGSAEGLI